jgi:hypothetical protein
LILLYKMKEKLNIIEIILITMQSLGGLQKTLDSEDIAKKANKVSPNSFTWKKYNDQIDLSLIKTSLYQAKKKQLISGNEKEGWILSSKGFDKILNSKNKTKSFKLRSLKMDIKEQNREISRIKNNKIYQKYHDQKSKPSLIEMEQIFRINLYMTDFKRKSIVNKTINLCKSDLSIYDFLRKNKKILNKGENK